MFGTPPCLHFAMPLTPPQLSNPMNQPENKTAHRLGALISITLFLAASFGAHAATAADNSSRYLTSSERETIADSLKQELSHAANGDDSIRILYDIADISHRQQQMLYLDTLYMAAIDNGRDNVAFDALRLHSNLSTDNDSILVALLRKARRLSDSPDRRETLAFISINRARFANNNLPEEARLRVVAEAIKRYSTYPPKDIYQQVQQLNELAIYLTNSASSKNMNMYLEHALSLTDSIDSKSQALRNSTLTTMATINIKNLDPVMSVEANNRLINLLDTLESRYHSHGRKYRQFNMSRYTAIRRILSQYPSLNLTEVDSLYVRAKELAANDKDVARSIKEQPAPEAYMLMAHKRYGEALPLLKQVYDTENERYINLNLFPMILQAAQATGDIATMLKYYPIYVASLQEKLEKQSEEKYKEFEIVYNTNGLKSQNTQLKDSYDSNRASIHKIVVISAIIVLFSLLALVVTLWLMVRRRRRLNLKLEETNRNLMNETENLVVTKQELTIARDKARRADMRKTEFINNMSHEITIPLDAIAEYSQLIVDCVDENRRRYLQRFADIVKLNVDLVTVIVNDVLEIGNLEDPKLKMRRLPCSLLNIIDTAVGATERNIKKGVEFVMPKEFDDDITIVTDKHRVEQVLINLLQNAFKFTDTGSVTLDYTISDDQAEITFEVTDTGIGIPNGKEKMIFERFEKIDVHAQGSGLGLAICSTVAKLLGGEVWAEEGRESGARFFFRIPIK